ncbi:MAG: type II toxin-antitoxin system VapC family toxin [Defluviitaleaceae bacterium]|nr:type II toxin-antitoxin system VapC family toxin [Defluviitaleaceae bacterium]
MKSLYIETTIPSLATSKPSRDMIIAGRQATTIFFWESERHKYDLYTSQYVMDECLQGDIEAAKRRLKFLEGITIISRSEQISGLANEYQKLLNMPDKSKIDCFHLAVCVISKMDYLMSWNCTHLGINTFIRIQKYNEVNSLLTPVLLTPEALLEI